MITEKDFQISFKNYLSNADGDADRLIPLTVVKSRVDSAYEQGVMRGFALHEKEILTDEQKEDIRKHAYKLFEEDCNEEFKHQLKLSIIKEYKEELMDEITVEYKDEIRDDLSYELERDIREELEREFDNRRDEVRTDGYDAGYSDGYDEAREEYEDRGSNDDNSIDMFIRDKSTLSLYVDIIKKEPKKDLYCRNFHNGKYELDWITLGADPEFELLTNDGIPISCGNVSTYEDSNIGRDGAGWQVEFRPEPSSDPFLLTLEMANLFSRWIRKNQNDKQYGLSVLGHKFPLGFHVHFGHYGWRSNEMSRYFSSKVKELHSTYDKLNGRARYSSGSFGGESDALRDQPHGFEYRRFPSALCFSPELFHASVDVLNRYYKHALNSTFDGLVDDALVDTESKLNSSYVRFESLVRKANISLMNGDVSEEWGQFYGAYSKYIPEVKLSNDTMSPTFKICIMDALKKISLTRKEIEFNSAYPIVIFGLNENRGYLTSNLEDVSLDSPIGTDIKHEHNVGLIEQLHCSINVHHGLHFGIPSQIRQIAKWSPNNYDANILVNSSTPKYTLRDSNNVSCVTGNMDYKNIMSSYLEQINKIAIGIYNKTVSFYKEKGV